MNAAGVVVSATETIHRWGRRAQPGAGREAAARAWLAGSVALAWQPPCARALPPPTWALHAPLLRAATTPR